MQSENITETTRRQPKIILQQVSENRETWLKAREGKITASTVSTVMGLNPYKTPLALWAEFTGKVQNDFDGNRSTRFGTMMEPHIAHWYSEDAKIDLSYPDTFYQDGELDWLCATPDYVNTAGEPIEIKTGSFRTARAWDNGDAPLSYKLQLMTQMRVLNKTAGTLVGMLGDVNSLNVSHLAYDSEVFDTVLERCAKFLECVKTDTPPPAVGDDSKLLMHLHERVDDCVLGAEQIEQVEFLTAQVVSYKETESTIAEELKKIENKRKDLESQLKQAMGNAKKVTFEDGRSVSIYTVEIKPRQVAGYSYERIKLPKAVK